MKASDKKRRKFHCPKCGRVVRKGHLSRCRFTSTPNKPFADGRKLPPDSL